MKKKNKIDEIRYNKKKRHWAWLFGRKEHKRDSAGLTHGKVIKEKNKPKRFTKKLPHNPNPNDKDISRFDPEFQNQHWRSYGEKDMTKHGWEMSKEDKAVIISFYKREIKRLKKLKEKKPP
jgi:hypothetical protein